MSSRARSRFERLVDFDAGFIGSGDGMLAGVDEAGRGALAGPVVAAAVICRPHDDLLEVRDSKLISENRREFLFDLIKEKCLAYSVGIVGPEEIDRINILRATMIAMRQAILGLSVDPGIVLVDGRQLPETMIRAVAVIKGDGKSFSVAAASIIAKVTRDRMMRVSDAEYPGYGFVRNKGYGTKEHFEAIHSLGKADIHRKSFRTGQWG
ncbi:MAG: ribonuclease HII [Bacteroidales bacterium]|nr:ribonuclease HII [Candidatus Latescibacterota bacterium]